MYKTLIPVALGCAALAACPTPPMNPKAEFQQRLMLLCDKAYEGKLVSDDPQDADFANQRIVMHVASCAADEIRIPLHVGDDHSRTWVLNFKGGIELKHDHRHEDGEPDAITQYGGTWDINPSGSRVNFPADEFSKAMFDVEGIPDSKQNTWAIEVRPTHELFAYELSRPNRFFRIEFDTSKPVDLPPPAWGSE